MAVLVLTSITDVTADLVIEALNDRGAEVVRLDPADAVDVGGVNFHARVGGSADAWSGSLATATRRVRLEEVAAVYYRRPSPWNSGHPEAQTAAFIKNEAKYGLGGLLYNLPGARYVNHPAATTAADFKPGQLQTAARLGFNVPATLLTNDVGEAARFAAEYEAVVYKPMRGMVHSGDGVAGAVWAQRIDPAALDDSVSVTAHTFQAEVLGKVADARVTVVGGRTFAQAITSPEGALDWRRGDWRRLRYEPVAVPGPIAEKLHAYLNHYDLVFGAFDFALTGPEGDPAQWWWMECNANGQWGWLPDSGHIADAFARTLTEERA